MFHPIEMPEVLSQVHTINISCTALGEHKVFKIQISTSYFQETEVYHYKNQYKKEQ